MGEKKVRLLNRNGVRTAVFLLFVVCTILAIACVTFQLVEWRIPVLVVYLASWILAFSATRCPHCGRFKVPIRPFRKAPPRCLNCGKELGQEVGSETPVCRRLRNLRSEAGLAPSQVAEHLGLSQAVYSKYETGEGDVPAQTLTELARFFHTTTDYILGLSDER